MSVRGVLMLVGLTFAAGAQAQATPAAQVPAAVAPAKLIFHFEHAGLAVPVYTFTLLDSGEGTYTAADPAVLTTLHLVPVTYTQIFDQIRMPGAFRGCSSRARNVANTGIKTITYSGAGGTQTCTFNYSDSKIMSALTDKFEGMESVREAGEQLERLHRFDRLGLDQAMLDLVTSVKEGRAAGLANIAAVLRSLIDDPQVLERVRMNAKKLFDQGAAGK